LVIEDEELFDSRVVVDAVAAVELAAVIAIVAVLDAS